MSFCAFSGNLIQSDSIIVTTLGDSVTFTCLCPKSFISLKWFKQTMGQKPILMVSYYSTNATFPHENFNDDFKVTNRMSVKKELDSCNLTIFKTQPGDSATYYCSAVRSNTIHFGNGTFLILKGSGSNTKEVVQQPVSESIQTGDSVTLNCTIHTESGAGEHSVYWFRQGSGESRPGILYTHGGRSDQCEKSPEAGSPTQSCVYNLPKRNLSLSDAGTYYCAVASCGEILFGNGTMLDIQEGPDTSDCQTEYRTASVSRANEQVSDDVNLNYSTLKFTDKKKTKPRRQRQHSLH
ncbi:signal-regulatory protein beta-2-like [Osmerus eperlanus]|uniref:signal-regulatory protein beta-2-like n=1 Tax=Osmerus eperlanus TaxID=29151 RepID=UPI002E1230D9